MYKDKDENYREGVEKVMLRMLWTDNEVLDGAPYMEALRFRGRVMGGTEPHKHDFPEFMGFFSTDPDDPYNLDGTVDFWIEDEKITLTKSCILFAPEGVVHSPLQFPEVGRPIFNISGGTGRSYSRLK